MGVILLTERREKRNRKEKIYIVNYIARSQARRPTIVEEIISFLGEEEYHENWHTDIS